jgi:hypothetical protein
VNRDTRRSFVSLSFGGRARRTRPRRAVGVLALLAAVCAAVPSVAAAAGASYVAMGDSYTSGPGVLPPSPTAPADCGQSAANYPHLVAAALNLSLTDVSCGGAKTEDFTVAQFPDQPPQFNALGSSTEVVTVGMGGNDNNLFATVLTDCTVLDSGKPNEGAPCRKQLARYVNETFAADKGPQEAALAEIHVLAPKAKVFVVGYPEVTPEEGYCPTAIPWTTGDLKWFRDNVQKKGNGLIKKGAKANGAIFVDTFKPSAGHNACEAVGVRWIEPLFGSLTGVPVHPNALGEENDAFAVELAMLRNGVR